ncbi:MAG TPA: esterase-like activity of phytase family protein, partial [Blastocatellia bacterium]|nr:esterase-like activity of phytase family protein [Blastocatellia bacterium]
NFTSQPAKVESVVNLPGNYDLEGIAINPQGGFWLVSEGAGSFGASGATKNLLLKVNADGTVAQTIELPAGLNSKQVQYGFEGVTTSSDGTFIYVALQREWTDDPAGLVKIGRYSVASGEWKFFHYPIETAPTGGWIGLSELTRIDDVTFAVIERDNQLRKNARIKRIYKFSIAGLQPAGVGENLPVVTKTLVRDLLVQDNFLLEKAEGLTITANGDMILASDNDGVGETRVIRMPNDDYNIFLQDDQTGDQLRVNTRTGDFIFTRCRTGASVSGRALIQQVGCQIKLKSVKVAITINKCAGYSFGKAEVKLLQQGSRIDLEDRNVNDNVTACR